jgi:hypothetical protein
MMKELFSVLLVQVSPRLEWMTKTELLRDSKIRTRNGFRDFLEETVAMVGFNSLRVIGGRNK